MTPLYQITANNQGLNWFKKNVQPQKNLMGRNGSVVVELKDGTLTRAWRDCNLGYWYAHEEGWGSQHLEDRLVRWRYLSKEEEQDVYEQWERRNPVEAIKERRKKMIPKFLEMIRAKETCMESKG